MLVRPSLEYSSTVWDPYTQCDIDRIEAVQRHSARFVCRRYHNTSSVTTMMQELNWLPLAVRRQHARLKLMYKLSRNELNINCDHILRSVTHDHDTKGKNEFTYVRLWGTQNYYNNSFFPRTIQEWNALPNALVQADNINIFNSALNKLHYNI